MTCFTKSNYVTHLAFCGGMRDAFNRGYLLGTDRGTLDAIYTEVDKIFSLPMTEIAEFVVRFYDLPKEKLIDFEKCVNMTKRLYPFVLR